MRERAMDICAVSADFGGYGFQIEEQNRARIEDTRRVMDMAQTWTAASWSPASG